MLEQCLEKDCIAETLIEEAHALGYDVSIFKRYRFNTMQVFEIIQGMRSNIDYKYYASPNWTYFEMRSCRLQMEQGEFTDVVH